MVSALIADGFISSIPRDPSVQYGYMYYMYGPGNGAGAIMVTYLEDVPASTAGPLGSCRPFDQNWCSSTLPSSAYCVCHPY